MALHMPRRRGSLATATAFGLAAAIVAFGGTAPANAAPGDTAEAEGRFLTFSGTPDLTALAELSGAYVGFAPGETPDPQVDRGVLDAAVLSGVLQAQIAAGVQLGDVLTLDQAVAAGAVDQFASAGSAGATGSAGLLTDAGAIAVNGGTGDAVTLDLAPLLASRQLDGVLSDADIRLGAVSATATDPGAGPVTRSYRIASGQVELASPAVGELADDLTGVVQALAPDVDGTIVLDDAATSGVLEDALGGLVAGLGGVADVDGAVTLDLDVDAAVAALRATPITNGVASIDLTAGTVTIDLQALNGLAPDTDLLDAATLSGIVDDVLSDALPAAVLDAVLASTAVSVDIDADLLALGIGLPLGTIGVAALVADGPAPRVEVTTSLLGIDVAALETALTQPVLDLVQDATADTLQLGTVTQLTDALIGSLDPLIDTLRQVVQLTVNHQDDSGFVDPAGTDSGTSTVTALRIALLTGAGGPVIDLASATVRAVPAPVADDVVIQTPAEGQLIPLPGGATTVAVPVTGTADPDAEVILSVDGGTASAPVAVGADGTFQLTTQPLPAGTHTATVTQLIGGVAAGTDTVTFVVGDPLGPLTITTPTPGQVLLTTPADPTLDVPVEGAADPRATVTVAIPGQATQTEPVGTDGAYDVVFPDLPVGDYTATVTVARGSAARRRPRRSPSRSAPPPPR
jgi:hypothetical protein